MDPIDKIKPRTRQMLFPVRLTAAALRVRAMKNPVQARALQERNLDTAVRKFVARQVGSQPMTLQERDALTRYAAVKVPFAKRPSFGDLLELAKTGAVSFKFIQAMLDAREKAIQQFLKDWAESIEKNARLDKEAHKRSRRMAAERQRAQLTAVANAQVEIARAYRRQLAALAPADTFIPTWSSAFHIDASALLRDAAALYSPVAAGDALLASEVRPSTSSFARVPFKLSNKPLLVIPLRGVGGFGLRDKYWRA